MPPETAQTIPLELRSAADGVSASGNYSFTIPTGVTSVEVEIWKSDGSSTGSGGAIGGYSRLRMAVIPGQVITVSVGDGR